jgi:hypothetical protein
MKQILLRQQEKRAKGSLANYNVRGQDWEVPNQLPI